MCQGPENYWQAIHSRVPCLERGKTNLGSKQGEDACAATNIKHYLSLEHIGV